MSGTDALPYLGDRYALLSRIGAGGMGCVYLAQDTKHERRVAVKVLDPVYGRAVGTQRFVREIRIAAMLTHPNIVPLYDSGEFEGQLFYVMPHIDGQSLRDRLKRDLMLPLGRPFNGRRRSRMHSPSPIPMESSTATSSRKTSSFKVTAWSSRTSEWLAPSTWPRTKTSRASNWSSALRST